MRSTPFTQLLNIELPIQLAPMGNMTPPELVVAISNTGGLGMFAAPTIPPDVLTLILSQLRAAIGDRKFGVGFLMPFLDPACAEIAAEHADAVEFFYDTPDPALVKTVHEHTALAGWQVGSRQEATAAADAGCDYVVAQGVEAGGHVRGTTPLLELIPGVVATVDIPVVASGGLGDSRSVAEAFRAGAHGVRIGTRLLAASESVAHPDYIQALIDAGADDTTLTTAYSVMWPNAPHRVLKSCIEAANATPDEIVGEFEIGGEKQPAPKFIVIPPDRNTTGIISAMALYAGRSVEHVHGVQPAVEIITELLAETPWASGRG